MTTFDERERALENRYAHDQELTFRAVARRNYKMGLWAARRLGHEGAKAEDDAQALVARGVSGEGDPALVAHLEQWLEQGGVHASREELVRQLAAFMTEARQELQGP